MKKIKENLVSIIAITVIIATILPMIYFFRHSVLGGDDFLFGRETFHAIQDTGSYANALKIAIINTADTYMHWQGSFFSIFLMYLHPGIISLNLYRIVLVLIFLLGIVSPIIAAFTLNKHFLKAKKEYIWIILASYIFVITQYMPSIYQAYYWFNGVIYYQFTFSITLLFISAFVKYRYCKKKYVKILLIIALIIMSIMIGGSNFPIGLMLALALSLYIAMAHIRKYENRKIDTIIFGVFLVIFLINVLAPGNGERQATYSIAPSLFSAAFASIRDMMIETPIWIKGTLTLGIVCAFLPISRKLTQNSRLKFVHPLIAAGVILILLLAQYFPVEYGLGSKGPARVENLRFMLLNIGIWLFFINMFGYYRDKEKAVNKFVALVLAIVLIAYPLSERGINRFTSYKMADQISGGELKQFTQIINAELAQFEASEINGTVSYDSHMTNKFLHPDEIFWFHSGIWGYYRKVPK